MCIYLNYDTDYQFECKQIISSYESLRQQAICPAKDFYHDLRDAIEYSESKESHKTERGAKEVQTIADLFTIDEYA